MSKEEVVEAPDGTLEQGDFKIKKKPKKLVIKEKVTKVNMAKKEEPKEETKTEPTAVKETKVEEVKVEQPVVEETKAEESPVIEEIKVEETKEEVKETKEVVEEIKEEVKENPQIELPENIEKLVNFMKDTGGTVEDYVNLNKDYAKLNGEQLLKEYYSVSKPHLNSEEINFLMDDNFAWDEDEDARVVKKKKLAYKDAIAKAKRFLNSSKDK